MGRYRNGDRSCWWRVNRTDRLYGVVEELRSVSPRARSATWLARRFEVSVRTIERDLGALRQGGIEVLPADARALDQAGLTAVAAGLHPWHGDLVVDVERQTVGGVWSDGGVGGQAVIVVTDGAVARSWSLPGTRPLAY